MQLGIMTEITIRIKLLANGIDPDLAVVVVVVVTVDGLLQLSVAQHLKV